MENEYDKLKYEKYYSTIYSRSNMIDPRSTTRFYESCFGWGLPAERNLPVLDFGAGLGNLMFWLKQKGFSNVSGIDLSLEQCEMARKISNIEVQYCQDSLQYLREHPMAFNIIFMSDVIEHLPKSEMPKYLCAIHDALIPGGFLVLKTDNVSSPTGIYQHHMDFTHEYTFVESSLKQLLLMCSFEDVKMKGESIPWPRRPWLWWKPVVRHLYWWLLRLVYEAEQPRGVNNPTIFSKSLIACCRRPLS